VSADLDHRSPPAPGLDAKLRRWVDESLITATEAAAIRAFEAREARAEPHGIPLLTEALIYVGAGLATAAAAVLLGQTWEDLPSIVRCVLVALACVVTLGVGAALFRSDDPALMRVTSIAWLVATGLFGWLASLIAHDVLEHGGRVPPISAGVAMALLGAALYALRRRGLQQLAMVVGALLAVASAFGDGGTGAMVAVWAVAVAWVAAGQTGVLPPKDVALVGGSLVAIWAPMSITGDGNFGLWLGLGTGVALLVAGVAGRQTLLLGLGAFGTFVYVLRILFRYFGDSAAIPVVLLIAGAVALGLGIWYARRSATRSARRSPS
jgi:hypothetical protein